jgi:hypothetical protein
MAIARAKTKTKTKTKTKKQKYRDPSTALLTRCCEQLRLRMTIVMVVQDEDSTRNGRGTRNGKGKRNGNATAMTAGAIAT